MLPFTGNVNNRAVDIRQTLDTAGDHQLAVAYQQNVITNTSAHAATREFLEFLDLRQLFPACTYDCACNRMLRKLLGCCGKCQTVLFGELLRGINLFNLQIAGGHCAGLVEYDQTQVCSPFHRFAALHVNAFALKSAAAAYKSKRYSQRQCGRTAGDEKRQSAIYPAGHIRTGHEQRRKCGCQYGNDDHNRNQALGITLRTVFQRCLVFGSCILYAANLTNRAVLVARDYTNQHQRAVIPAACQHARILINCHRHVFTGKHAVIHRAVSAKHNTVNRYALTRVHQNQLTQTDICQRNLTLFALHVDDRCLFRHEIMLLWQRLIGGCQNDITCDFANLEQDEHNRCFCTAAERECADRRY